MCVEILLYSAILFTFKFTDHVIAANYPYDEIPGERDAKEILIFH